jgi:hypothetical protein
MQQIAAASFDFESLVGDIQLILILTHTHASSSLLDEQLAININISRGIKELPVTIGIHV